MRVCVIGGSGPLGLEVIKQGLALGHIIRAVARNPAALKEKLGPLGDKIEIIAGDLEKSSNLDDALLRQEAVISAFGTGLIRKPTTILSGGTKNLVDAMTRCGVRRLVCVTGIGAGDSLGHGGFFYNKILEPYLLHEIYQDKTRQEKVIALSQLEWVIVRPAVLTNGSKTGIFDVVSDMTGFQARKISRADVASFLLDQIQQDHWLRKTVVLSYK